MSITAATNLGEIAVRLPHVAEYLQREWGLHCVNCIANALDTFEDGMRLHGYSDKEITEALSAVNRIAGEPRPSGGETAVVS
ncbi:MAG: hypothetical protein A2991_01350 [Candidatus Terrybacteria bacterium RIFCSPLOWO2_01_FULL_58_14]|uniref:DUF1858 domain-containing protein n=2 Tax=Candidatus Terryibacteriota TaxID=1817920 RepID=A0A1G2PYR0_9BACT|nr:MAG: hypothetical protein A2682_01740 [Candidatus Terrybacteria bacterium RIFCSPHIGHO2_01_FULL_58_15]OHA53468.1 MAG: hypothetical protein A2991_01350 [Candidatus Terrybacteria bacterium RIFCSPLOWO2_01_FULL_58_14]